ncbi:hypothetical protein MPH_03627 [Macrophomina phaseolina MS6]|uniref:non-specific serine/threonine protein kinase n=1 Tax=Macrophomina phaseolina (strain MS6) TaxID=1126212 RepID=K2R9F0_MACPH|nr:hypothetical protein MPH_03627 [Macrophomina phaseolina MS6]
MQDADNYQVLEELGSGSFGVVYKAIEKSTGDIVAIKHIDLEGSDDDIREIQQEIALLSTCASPFVTQYKTSFVRGVKLWIVMEYLGGGSCLDLMKPGPFSEAHTAIICRELLLGLDYLHQSGKIHRDIKAANVLLSQSGKVKIADFGVAAQLTNIKSQRMTFVGTPYWMAPEVIQEMGYDFKADIWSLGITAMELAKGEPPHADTHPMKVLFHIPKAPAPRLEGNEWSKDYKDFVASCLIKDPDRRPTAKELLKHKFIQRAGKVEALQELIDRRKMYDAASAKSSHPKYYEETMRNISPTTLHEDAEDDEWVFDTVKPAKTQRKRQPSKVEYPEDLVEKLDINSTPLGTSAPTHGSNGYRTANKRPSSRHSNAGFNQGSTVSTARRVSGAREPLAVDMSFGNSNSTVRQFRRVSSAGLEMHPEEVPPVPSRPANIHASFSSADTLIPEVQNENTPPLTGGPMGTVSRLTKESLMGRRAYVKAIDGAFHETHAQTGSQQNRDALAKVAQAWAALDRVDPEGEFLLLKNMVDRIQADPKLAAALGVAPSGMPPTPVSPTPMTPAKSRAPAVLSPTSTSNGKSNDPFYTDSSSISPTTPAKQNGNKLVMAQANPHLKGNQRRRQSAISNPGSDHSSSNDSSASGEKRRGSGNIDEKKLPGYVKPGMEHTGLLADVLYGRWTEGLAAKWART